MNKKITVIQQLQLDRDIYGMSIERKREDGTIERIDPTTVKIKYLKKEIIERTCRDDWPGTKTLL